MALLDGSGETEKETHGRKWDGEREERTQTERIDTGESESERKRP